MRRVAVPRLECGVEPVLGVVSGPWHAHAEQSESRRGDRDEQRRLALTVGGKVAHSVAREFEARQFDDDGADRRPQERTLRSARFACGDHGTRLVGAQRTPAARAAASADFGEVLSG